MEEKEEGLQSGQAIGLGGENGPLGTTVFVREPPELVLAVTVHQLDDATWLATPWLHGKESFVPRNNNTWCNEPIKRESFEIKI